MPWWLAAALLLVVLLGGLPRVRDLLTWGALLALFLAYQPGDLAAWTEALGTDLRALHGLLQHTALYRLARNVTGV